jgi:hypothetical protein
MAYKRISSMVRVGLLLLVIAVPLSTSWAFIPGDANSDSKITLADAIYLVNFIFRSGKPPVPPEAGDVNASCTVTLSDIIGLVNYIFKGMPIQGCPAWGQPQNLGSPPNSNGGEYSPGISSNGLVLYFAHPTPPSGLEDIFQSIWNGFNWSEPVKLNDNINSLGWEQDPCISADGKKLYFSAYDRPGGYGKFDVWVSEWDTTLNDWSPPTNLGPNINTGGWDYGPSISSDGKTLYFVSDSLLPNAGIFKSTWNGTSWGPAVRLSENVNINSTSEAPSISPDGLTLYFTLQSIAGKQTYVSYWDGLDWTLAQFLEAANDSATAAGPQISFNGRTLYFYSSRSAGSYGGHDIWMIRR